MDTKYVGPIKSLTINQLVEYIQKCEPGLVAAAQEELVNRVGYRVVDWALKFTKGDEDEAASIANTAMIKALAELRTDGAGLNLSAPSALSHPSDLSHSMFKKVTPLQHPNAFMPRLQKAVRWMSLNWLNHQKKEAERYVTYTDHFEPGLNEEEHEAYGEFADPDSDVNMHCFEMHVGGVVEKLEKLHSKKLHRAPRIKQQIEAYAWAALALRTTHRGHRNWDALERIAMIRVQQTAGDNKREAAQEISSFHVANHEIRMRLAKMDGGEGLADSEKPLNSNREAVVFEALAVFGEKLFIQSAVVQEDFVAAA